MKTEKEIREEIKYLEKSFAEDMDKTHQAKEIQMLKWVLGEE